MADTETEEATTPSSKSSWWPLAALFMGQVLMSFNVAALPVSLGGMVQDFGVAPTVASTTIVIYGVAVAAVVMTGAKLGQRVGWVLMFRIVIASFAASALVMVLSPSIGWAIAGQALAGVSAAIIVPSLVALIAENYRGAQQATAVGSLGSARAISGVTAFLIGGTLGTLVGWRPVFIVVLVIAVVVFALSFTLRGDRGDDSVKIDLVGSALIGVGIILLTLGFNNLNAWGVVAANDGAPFSVLGLSPAPVMIVLGVVLVQLFFVRARSRLRRGQVPLIDTRILSKPTERAAVYAMFIVVGLEACVNFTVPLYIQIVQGRTPFDTSLAMMPFNLTVFVTATLVVRLYARFSPRTIGVWGFVLTTVALAWLAMVVTNNWETPPTILGLIVFGVGQGALVTLVFNVLVTSAPARLAGDVGSLRGTTQNLASAVGTALAGALFVSLLGLAALRAVAAHPEVPPVMVSQVELGDVNFTSNDDLRAALEGMDVSEQEVEAAVSVNEEARLNALRWGFLLLGGISAVAIVPASRLPRYRPEEIPDPSPVAGDGPKKA